MLYLHSLRIIYHNECPNYRILFKHIATNFIEKERDFHLICNCPFPFVLRGITFGLLSLNYQGL